MPIEPTNSTSLWSSLQKAAQISGINVAEVQITTSGLKRVVLCAYGGLLVFIDLVTPKLVRDMTRFTNQKDLGTFPREFCHFGYSPLELEESSSKILSIDESPFVNSCVFVNYPYIEVFSAQQGNFIYQRTISTNNDNDTGQPSAVHFCEALAVFAVGFSSGKLLLLPIKQHKSIPGVDSRRVHGSPITAIRSFSISKTRSILILGDASGKVSTWPINKKATNPANELAVDETHGSGIVTLKLISTAAVGLTYVSKSPSKFTLVSSSRNGQIRAWSVGKGGSLSLLAFSSFEGEATSMAAAIFRYESGGLESRPMTDYVEESTSDQLLMGGKLSDYEAGAFSTSITDGSVYSTQQLDSKSALESKEVFISIVCVCGYSNGLIKSFVLSNDTKVMHQNPIAAEFSHIFSVTTMDIFSCQQIDNMSPNYKLLSASLDGTIYLSSLSGDGQLKKLHSIYSNGDITSIVGRYYFGNNFIECLSLDSKCVSKILISASSVPNDWFTTKAETPAPMSQAIDVYKSRTAERTRSVTPQEQLKLSTTEISAPPSPPIKFFLEKDDELDEISIDSFPHDILDGKLVDRKLSYSHSNLLKPLTPFERIQTSDIQVVKKDKKFLDIFKQEDKTGEGTVVASSIPTMINKWMSGHLVSKESIWELLNLLGVGDEDEMVGFLVVCKAAVTTLFLYSYFILILLMLKLYF
jgi:hypothetical protein